MSSLYIGLMSGTSMDGIDAALVNFSQIQPKLLVHHTKAIPANLLADTHRLCNPQNNEINQLGVIDRQLGQLFGETVNELLAKACIDAKQIAAIGSHGQTVRHMPDLHSAFTLQIGDPNTIAVTTGIDVIADFRRKDIALGGQGAPLVPAFHHYLFAKADIKRVILNIGGIANITFLPGNEEKILGLDTGPGNTLMDYWTRQHLHTSYDKDGQWAASGKTDPQLLEKLLAHPYFLQVAPKSTGRETFNDIWLENELSQFNHLTQADIQSTLLDLTCQTIASSIQAMTSNGEVYLCGGGAYNLELIRRLKRCLPEHSIDTTAALGLDPQWVEATAFAWLAKRFKQKLPANLPAVTGASRPARLGALYPAD